MPATTARSEEPGAPAVPVVGEEAAIDLQAVRDWAGFVWDAVRARAGRTTGVFLMALGAALGWLAWGPRFYHTQTVILAQKNVVISSLANPKRSVPADADAPTWAARETVMRRDNLVALIKGTDLLDQWQTSRPPLLRLKDLAVRLVLGPQDEADALDTMISTLRLHLDIAAKEGTVTIAIDWPDPVMAYRLVEAAQQNFLEARHAAETSAIAESIAILEQNVADARSRVQTLLHAVEPHASALPRAPGSRKRDESANTERIATLLEAKHRTIEDLEEFRRKRLGELQVHLAEERAMYAPAHPLVQATEQSILALSQESAQVAQLRREEQELRTQLANVQAAELASGTSAVARAETENQAITAPSFPGPASADAPAREYTEQRMRLNADKYEELLDRLNEARIELEATRAAFKYRYSVVDPPTVPKFRAKPKVPVFLAGSFVGALLAALGWALGAELAFGRISRAWQVQRRLGLPVVGEVNLQ